ncbi:relaxase/mobilization nuclease domain-containing protein [Nocardia vaccinii]|uniref:relaxase/mobilization nuclease domain-containing protein n=1 Tax=Nocardia vaccinii TaxID=1822 RepID=UPI00082BA488|nr:relaxase/mobilization nuclease domain-containing protein [Nocardia vaccinii]
MIGKIRKGWNAPKLVSYLVGPGRHNEHTRPTVIAAWQNDPQALQPTRIGPGDFDYAPGEVRKLGAHVNAAADAAGLPYVQPLPGELDYTKHGYVWHASVTLDPVDGVLDFDTWAALAAEIMAATGIAPAEDAGGCRWIAVHHGTNRAGSDHIHIAAVLVRQDTGRRFYPQNDYARVRAVVRRWETKLGLRATAAPRRSGSTPQATRGEQEKAARRAAKGRPGVRTAQPGTAARVQLRQVIRESAALASGPDELLARLRDLGVLVQLRRDSRGRITGWAVAAAGDVSARTGEPIWWSVGRDISADLSWPRLISRWTTTTTTGPRAAGETLGGAATILRDAASRLHTDPDSPAAEHIAYELHTVLAAYTAVAPGRTLRELLHDYEHIVLAPEPPPALAARRLRQVAADLAALRTLIGVRRDPVLELAAALAALAIEVAHWHQTRERPHHADRARAIAAALTGTASGPPRRAPAANTARRQPHPTESTLRATTAPPHPSTTRSTRQ